MWTAFGYVVVMVMALLSNMVTCQDDPKKQPAGTMKVPSGMSMQDFYDHVCIVLPLFLLLLVLLQLLFMKLLLLLLLLLLPLL